jgi:hypothetical protein
VRGNIVYPFPLAEFKAQFVLPDDLTSDEVARICAFIKSLEIPKEVKA